jgi:hypothetical protein
VLLFVRSQAELKMRFAPLPATGSGWHVVGLVAEEVFGRSL